MMRRDMKPAGARRGRIVVARGRALSVSLSVCVLISIAACGVAWGEGTPATPLERLRSNWQGRKSLIAHFTQTQTFTGFEEPLESRGTLRILRPSRFDILYDPPSRQRQVCDGTYVWTYVPEQKQVVKATLSPEATRGADLLDWALDGATLLSSTPDDSMGAGGERLAVEPGPQLPLQALTIWMRGTDAELLGYEAVDTEGNRTRMHFVDLRAAKGLKAADFAFQPPPGVEVVEMGGGR